MTMDLSNRIRAALDHSGKTQAAVARELNITQSAITQWLSGRTKALRAETALSLERATGVRAAWIASGLGPKLVDPDEKSSSGLSGLVLLVSWEQAALWAAGENRQIEKRDTWINCPVDHTDGAYALRVRGSSMYNPAGPISFFDGDIIYVEPEREPVDGSIVLAQIGSDKDLTFRQLLIEGDSSFLQALNPAWPQRILDAKESRVKLAGVVVARTTILT